ncbi:uncharacterized mitochondrial protein AtMg00810-like [Setaria viridis]|uniref:uncharacterized mitochondrial protein AtMg00810-like n=1 Tax=Setaria viridis TaxID=4556 RepID=UPI0014934FFF|nr:uncharacterized mitochondrial protein AtMg00810-like [Setaria viridis]
MADIVDDIVLTASSSTLLWHIMGRLYSEFAMMDLGDLHHFLSISITSFSLGLFLSQRQYAFDTLQRAGMAECHSITTPVDTHAKLSAHNDAMLQDGSEYQSLAGVCLFMHDPREPHMALIKCIVCYVKGTPSSGFHIGTGPVQSLTAYSDADWAGYPDSRRSTSGFCVYLGDNLVSWSSKR